MTVDELFEKGEERATKYLGNYDPKTEAGWERLCSFRAGFAGAVSELSSTAHSYNRLIAYLRTCHLSGQAKKDIELIIGETL